MPTFSDFAAEVKRLDRALAALEPEAASVGAPTPAGSEWFDLLRNKLLAQLEMPPLLVVAIVGGTNIGKSAVFNHLAGEVASTSSPLAAGTKHPVCLVPPALAAPQLLEQLFEQFELRAWHSADDPLEECAENLVFWRTSSTIPPRLLLIDAPDVDSDVTMNWQRATAIRQTADVLIAILTQQKYNDAAIKQFFRAAVEADKPIIVLFNQCELQYDRQYWPQWLATFCEHTGAKPESAYVIPYDRQAAEELRLPFYTISATNEASASAASQRKSGQEAAGELQKADLRAELASLRFDAIKIRTFRGALQRVLDEQRGLPGYMKTIRATAAEFQAAATALSATEMARVAWPALPASVLVDEIAAWWDASREAWSRRIHGFYRTLGRGMTWPVRAAWNAVSGPSSPPTVAFQQQERAAIVMAVEKLLDELTRLSQVGSETLRPRLARLLGGHARATLLERVQTAHDQLPAVDEDYRVFLRAELDAWRDANPRAVRFLHSLDHAAALARPAVTVALFFTGLHFAGDIVGQTAIQVAGSTAGHIATEAAIAGGITGGGEAIVSTTSEGVRQAAGRLFIRLQSRYAQQRAAWLAEWLEQELLGELLADLRHGAEVPQSEPFRQVEAIVQSLRELGARS